MSKDQDFTGFAAFEALPEAIVIADVDQQIQFINSAACRLLRIDRDSALGALIKSLPGSRELMNAEQTKVHYTLFNFYGAPYGIKVSMPQPYESTWRNRIEGDRLIEYRSSPILDDNQQPIGIIMKVSDATDEQTASELLSIMFHEILTPLTFITGYAELLETQSALTEEQREMLQIISEKAQYLLQLRHELYEAAKERLWYKTAHAS